MDLDEKLAALRSTSCSGNWQRIHARTPASTAAAIMAALAMMVDPIYRYRYVFQKKNVMTKEKTIVTRASHVVTHRTTGRA
jgi:hypothetical protein